MNRTEARPSIAFISTLAASALACSGGEATKGPPLAIDVHPLTLPGIVEATYTIAVDAGGDRVWQKTITSSAYGDGRGSATYIGTCDATQNPNRVSLVLDSLVEAPARTLRPADFTNPAPSTKPIVLEVDCVDNGDVRVTFDLAIMRAARQGFFDVAVNFDDVFCSAKVDCAYPSGPITLLHDPRTGERGPTMNLGFACTTGARADGDTPAPAPSWLYLSDVVIDCGEEVVHLDPSHPLPGNQGAHLPVVFQWGLYRGVEFTQAQVDFDKCFTNLAIGLDTTWLQGRSCTLRATGTAATTLWADGRIPANTTYPVVTFEVPLGADAGAIQCSPAQHALNGADSGVTTDYVFPGDPRPALFAYAFDCASGEVETPGGLSCAGALPDSSDTLRVTTVDGGVQLAVGQALSPVYALPSSVLGQAVVGLGDTCCVDPCCAE